MTALAKNWKGIMRAARPVAPLAVAMFVAACAVPEPPARVPNKPPDTASTFQGHLDRLGVTYRTTPRGKSILVNVPAFELIAFEDGEPALRSRIIVGTPWNPTPLLETYTTAVRFRPRWRPTPEMVASGEYEDKIWPPGRRNPLGLAAIRLEPGLLVYLHDTNRRNLFERDDRALSHGCVRVQRWDELIAWLLGIPLDEVHRHANGRRTFDMPTSPVRVTLGYYTLFPDDAGEPVRYPDLYGRNPGVADENVRALGTGPLAAAPGPLTCGSATG